MTLIWAGGGASIPTVLAAPLAEEVFGVGQIAFSGGQVIAGASVLLGGITSLFWLLLASKDAQLKQAYADLTAARIDSAASHAQVVDLLRGAIRSGEDAAKASAEATRQLMAITTAEHGEMVSVLQDLSDRSRTNQSEAQPNRPPRPARST